MAGEAKSKVIKQSGCRLDSNLLIRLQKINQIESLTATVYRRCLTISEVGHTTCLPSDSVNSGTRAEDTLKKPERSAVSFPFTAKFIWSDWKNSQWKLFFLNNKIKEFTQLSWARQHREIVMGVYFPLPCKVFTNCSMSKL